MNLDFQLLIYLIYSILFIKAERFPYFHITGCPPRNSTTASEIITQITFDTYFKSWPLNFHFIIRKDLREIYKYHPLSTKVIIDDERFTIIGKIIYKDFSIKTKFLRYDSGVDFQYGFKENKLSEFTFICGILVNEDLTPVANLERRAPPETGIREKSSYYEGEKIIVICRVLNLIKGDFTVNFPLGANEKLIDEMSKTRAYSLYLKRKIKGGNISCIVPNGISVWSTEFLRFMDKPKIETEPSRTGVAIAFSVITFILVIIMMIFGIYTLIVKQRSDNTKVLLEHHTNIAETRRMSEYSVLAKSYLGPSNSGYN